MDIETAWELLIDNGIARNDELVLVTSINGYTLEQMENVLYAKTGLNSFSQLED